MSKLINKEKDVDELLKSGKPSIVLFYASWCPFCQGFLPVFEKHAKGTAANFCRAEIDDMDTCEEKFSIDIVPTVLYFDKGKVAKRLDGKPGVGLNEKQLEALIASCSSSGN